MFIFTRVRIFLTIAEISNKIAEISSRNIPRDEASKEEGKNYTGKTDGFSNRCGEIIFK
jgi:hypothetical protein